MTGADCLLRTAAAAGNRACFANPGTSELPLVAALGRVSEVRPVLCLFEGVCTGAADGYGRMAGVPGLSLLHLGPGLANGAANLHNARRAHTPLVNVVGDHATWHRSADPPLNTDIASIARPVSDWVREVRTAADLPRDAADAVAAAMSGQVATLIVPQDVQKQQAAGEAVRLPAPPPRPVDREIVRRAAGVLRRGSPAVVLLGGTALTERGLHAAVRVAAGAGCQLFCEPRPARMERGGALPAPPRLPYFPDQVLATLKPFRSVVLAGAREPVAFFGYDGFPSRLIDAGQEAITVAAPADDVPTTLEALADELGSPPQADVPAAARRPSPPTGPLTPETIAAALAAIQPEGAIVVDEGITAGVAYFAAAAGALRHSYLTLGGGSIGFGMPCATGAAVACPERKVINLQADGSGLYTAQALWTQAREGLDVTTLVLANRRYRILEIEAARSGEDFGSPARRLFGLAEPAPDWVQLAAGFGVPAARVTTADELVRELGRALAEDGPHLIEAVL
ncbi:MAG TPA: acetolactate synthase large subunit [Gemmataceae bacterium]|jgi:acetolactate synthase-1/2/3 large subunit